MSIDASTLAALRHILKGDSGKGAGTALVVVHGRRIVSVAWIGAKTDAQALCPPETVGSNGLSPSQPSVDRQP